MTVVAVHGCTGYEGASVADALLATGAVEVRVVALDSRSGVSKALAARGAHVVEADLNAKDSLIKAYRGANELFLVTDLYEEAGGDPGTEMQQSCNAIEAAQETGMSLIMYSTRDAIPRRVSKTLPTLDGGNATPSSASKAAIEEHLAASGIPYLLFLPGLMYEYILKYALFKKQSNGSYVFSDNLGERAHVWHAASDLGASLAVARSHQSKYMGKVIPLAGEYLTCHKIAEVISEVTNKTVRYQYMSLKQFAAQDTPHELANMYEFIGKWPNYNQHRAQGFILNGPSFADWAKANYVQLLAKLP